MAPMRNVGSMYARDQVVNTACFYSAVLHRGRSLRFLRTYVKAVVSSMCGLRCHRFRAAVVRTVQFETHMVYYGLLLFVLRCVVVSLKSSLTFA